MLYIIWILFILGIDPVIYSLLDSYCSHRLFKYYFRSPYSNYEAGRFFMIMVESAELSIKLLIYLFFISPKPPIILIPIIHTKIIIKPNTFWYATIVSIL